ncbi:hypothetical protein L2E82_34811 [Cichorium intybus]|uniref:Uncharacterized protein n=1 Tax=Cichorium intybus TaxID=13427 RepID=A0ACB9BMW6_CICIN|nr:hypothetical protein L2E82_34811 [Cichorium intybus]
MLMLRGKFEKLKEEMNADPGIFAGDLFHKECVVMRIPTTFWVFISLVILVPKVTESQPDTSHEEDQELDQTKGVSSSTGKRISSWKKLPNLAEKVLKDHNALDIPPKESPELKDEHHTPSSLICRICEVEIPTVHVEQHSRICTIADRCDLKGVSVNERLERVAETLERIMDEWTPTDTKADGN